MLAEAQQFFAFLREADVLVSELRKTRKRFLDALSERVTRSFFLR